MKASLFLFLFISFFGYTQDANPFAKEVLDIQKKYDTLWDAGKETIVFTGSSSVRMWKSLEKSFPKHQIVNSGFGGSQASDLLVYIKELILRFSPQKVFIYEGDNDISSKKKTKEILKDIQSIIDVIRNENPKTKIVLIAAKPSISRWHLKRKYKQLNRKFKKMSQANSDIDFVDVWTPMLNGRKIKKDIFIADGLHMNAKGYAIWYEAIKKYIEN